VEGTQDLGLGDGVEGATPVGEKIYAGQWFEAAAEAGLGSPDAFGDGGD
jgi:hypothetical protein